MGNHVSCNYDSKFPKRPIHCFRVRFLHCHHCVILCSMENLPHAEQVYVASSLTTKPMHMFPQITHIRPLARAAMLVQAGKPSRSKYIFILPLTWTLDANNGSFVFGKNSIGMGINWRRVIFSL